MGYNGIGLRHSKKYCPDCGKRIRPMNTYCNKHKAIGSRNPNFGNNMSQESKDRIGAANKGNQYGVGHGFSKEGMRKLRNQAYEMRRDGRLKTSFTSIHIKLGLYLIEHGWNVIPEVSFSPYHVDLYDPEEHIAFEADGEYFHKYKEGQIDRDNKRDKFLLKKYGLKVIRYTGTEIMTLQ